MKIYGDEPSSPFRNFIQKPGLIYGHDDVLAGEPIQIRRISYSFFSGQTDDTITVHPKLYLHLFNSTWSNFTGTLRQTLMPWRWKTAYLDKEDGSALEQVLVCDNASLSDQLQSLLNKSLFITHLIEENKYIELFGSDYLRVPREANPETIEITHPWGKWAGTHIEFNSSDQLCQIYRIQGIFSWISYQLTKIFSDEWQEVTVRVRQVSETVLIKKADQPALLRAGLISS